MSAGKHILVVDDEREFLFSAALALRIAGFSVSTAESGEDAITRIEEARMSGKPVDLLITDVQLPGMNGRALIDRLRENRPGLPVFVVTGYFHTDLEKELAERGCAGYLLKPFNPRVFAERISRYMEGGGSHGTTTGVR